MTTEDTTVAALLHDVAEDTDHTIEELAGMGFGANVVEALALLTHDKNTDYMDYVRAIRENPIARKNTSKRSRFWKNKKPLPPGSGFLIRGLRIKPRGLSPLSRSRTRDSGRWIP